MQNLDADPFDHLEFEFGAYILCGSSIHVPYLHTKYGRQTPPLSDRSGDIQVLQNRLFLDFLGITLDQTVTVVNSVSTIVSYSCVLYAGMAGIPACPARSIPIPACPFLRVPGREGGRKGGRRKREGKKGKGGKRKRGKGGKKGREGKGRKGEERKGGIPAGIPAYLRWDTRHWGKMPPKMAKKRKPDSSHGSYHHSDRITSSLYMQLIFLVRYFGIIHILRNTLGGGLAWEFSQ